MKLIGPAVDRLQCWFDDALVWVLELVVDWAERREERRKQKGTKDEGNSSGS